VTSQDQTEAQWPPEIPVTSPSPPPGQPTTPLPTFTVNDDVNNASTEPIEQPFRSATPHQYQETIDIEKSRPSSPTSGLERIQPVSVSETVVKYLETAHEPAERPRSGRARKTPEIAEEKSVSEGKPLEEIPQATVLVENKKEEKNEEKTQSSAVKKEKPKSTARDKLVIGIDVAKETKPKQQDSTLEQTEARREFVSSLLIKSNPTAQRGPLELEGIGKEGEEKESVSVLTTPLDAPAQSFAYEQPKKTELQTTKAVEPSKNDLSDLAALINRNKSAKATKEKVKT